LYSIYTRLHSASRSEQTLIEALELSNEIDDRTAQAKLNWNLMLTYLFSKRLDKALGPGEAALAIARQCEDRELLAFVLNDLCRLYSCLGQFEKAYEVIHEARELWIRLDNQAMLADSFGSEAEARFQAGDHDEALELLYRGLDLNQKTDNLWGQGYCHMLISFIYFDRGRIGQAIQLSTQAIAEGDEAGLAASSTCHRAELGWFYAYYGASEKGFELVEKALEFAEAKQPEFRMLPLAVKVRLYLLNGDVESAEKAAGPSPLELITIPYSRYTVIVSLANVELALARNDSLLALSLVEDLLTQVSAVTKVDIPVVLLRKADALRALGRLTEAQEVLTDACALAEKSGSNHHLWSILSSFADLHTLLNHQQQADFFRHKARDIVEMIAGGLELVGLREPFLQQPRVRSLVP
jgi:tetratricopeptide (TPR) repeat protein